MVLTRNFRISYYRVLKKARGQFYGPYPNGAAVYASLNFLQKTFVYGRVNSVFKHRSRPCLQYQIDRCAHHYSSSFRKKRRSLTIQRPFVLQGVLTSETISR